MEGQKKIAVYSRKSKYTGRGDSIGNQVELCRQYIRLHREAVAEADILVFEDEGFSGGNLKRPRFQQLMRAARAGQIREIICYRLDRISRNIGDFARLIEELNELEIAFVSIREQFDTSSSMGRAMMYIASVFSQLERETIAERIRDNMLELAKTGRWLGGVTPTGYCSQQLEQLSVDGKPHRLYQLATVAQEAETVRLIFREYLSRGSLTQLETWLLQRGLKSKNGKDFTRFTVRNILTNPVYAAADAATWQYFQATPVEVYAAEADFDGSRGIMAYNKTRQSAGKAHTLREAAEWIIAVGRHEPLVCGADWLKAQQLLAANSNRGYRKPRSQTALLSGLLFCDCGAYMRPKQGRPKQDGSPSYHYLCQRKEKSRLQNCAVKNPDGVVLDQAVCTSLQQIRLDKTRLIRGLEELGAQLAKHKDGGLRELMRQQQFLEREIKSLVTLLAKAEGEAAYAYINQQITALAAQSQALQEQITALQQQTKDGQPKMLPVSAAQLLSFPAAFALLPLQQKRLALRSLIQKAVWDGERLQIYFQGAVGETQAAAEPLREHSK